ncbi:oxaloacetate decarboxylase subunit alpha [Agrilactobacillus yilanensis]|uniref:Oxaloacetate decarboxylase subunit alpha n=1 Tax=Agrilactobacillus yilanensis TaxID=2485997 RepID=A0ABW4J8M0_9LACO|nr:oxaloacetate decarboxylase subunit alpha [Agrilactobacillus yilanensis]
MEGQRRIGITETILRDAHQSLMATRMPMADMLPILDTLDDIGYASLECWGGATFDACIRFLDEDPWQRLRTIKQHVTKTPLQMLLRGQNLLGYRHYADDVVTKFIEQSAENGIDIFRIFDALNDTRNLEAALKAVKKTGKEAQLTIVYTISEAHTLDYYAQLGNTLAQMGADSICIKDMAGILTGPKCAALVQRLKQTISLPIIVHTHCTSGIGQLTYQAAIAAGADRIDTALSPLSEGTSQPATESMVLNFDEAGYDTGIDLVKMGEAADYFRSLRPKYLSADLIDPKVLTADPRALIYQVPGGMLSNLYAQLKQANALDKYDAVLAEVPKVREDLGFPPLVTPLSQMVGTQAVMNVVTGKRYQMVPNEIKAYLMGEYGRSPVPVAADFRQQLIGDAPVITDRPADHIEAEFESLKTQLKTLAKTDEDVLTYALFPQVGKKFLEQKYQPTPQADEVIKVFGQY